MKELNFEIKDIFTKIEQDKSLLQLYFSNNIIYGDDYKETVTNRIKEIYNGVSYDDLKNLHTIYCPPPQRAAFLFSQRLLPHRDRPQKANNALLVHTRSGFCRSAFAGTRQSESETLARRDCSETARISRQQAIASARCWCRHRLFYFFAFAAWA